MLVLFHSRRNSCCAFTFWRWRLLNEQYHLFSIFPLLFQVIFYPNNSFFSLIFNLRLKKLIDRFLDTWSVRCQSPKKPPLCRHVSRFPRHFLPPPTQTVLYTTRQRYNQSCDGGRGTYLRNFFQSMSIRVQIR